MFVERQNTQNTANMHSDEKKIYDYGGKNRNSEVDSINHGGVFIIWSYFKWKIITKKLSMSI